MFLLILKVPLGVMISAMLAFALAKLRLRFGTAIMFAVFLGLTIPIYITIVPVFVLLRTMGAIDSVPGLVGPYLAFGDRKSTRLNSSHLVISYAVFCLKK